MLFGGRALGKFLQQLNTVQQHRIQGGRTDVESKTRARIQVGRAAATEINGNQKAANVTEIRCGMGVEVTERDHDEDRERDDGVIYPVARSRQDRGPNLHQRCRDGRCKQTQGLNLHPESHFNLHPRTQ